MLTNKEISEKLEKALFLLHSSEVDEAERILLEVEPYLESRNEICFVRGAAALKRGSYNEAVDWFSKVAVGTSRYIDSRWLMASVEMRFGKKKEAARHCADMLKADPDNVTLKNSVQLLLGPSKPSIIERIMNLVRREKF